MLFMKGKIAPAIMLTLLLTGTLTLAFKFQPVKAEPRTWIVDDDGPADFHTIEEAIAAASTGDMILVASGVYRPMDTCYYQIEISKSLRLIGENRNSTIIAGTLYSTADEIWVIGFTIGGNLPAEGVPPPSCIWPGDLIRFSGDNGVLADNMILGIGGRQLDNDVPSVEVLGSNWRIEGNVIIDPYLGSSNSLPGLFIGGSNSTVAFNQIGNETMPTCAWSIITYGNNNRFYHNNVCSQSYRPSPLVPEGVHSWNLSYPLGGNYWNTYNGEDILSGSYQNETGSDGIGDTPYIINADNADNYPLMNPYGAPPLQTYNLTITTTVGGTTDPAPGTYGYTANSTVQVTAIPAANYLFDYWELDGVNVGSANPYSVLMDKNHALKAVFSLIPPPLLASISPLSASILAGQSVTFTSTVSGGYMPYSYQWYLNGNPVSGANATSWTFTPTTSGIYYIHLKVTDAKANTAQSDAARIAVATVPVGGYSFPIQVQTKAEPVLPYIALIATLTAIFTKLRPKAKRKR